MICERDDKNLDIVCIAFAKEVEVLVRLRCFFINRHHEHMPRRGVHWRRFHIVCYLNSSCCYQGGISNFRTTHTIRRWFTSLFTRVCGDYLWRRCITSLISFDFFERHNCEKTFWFVNDLLKSGFHYLDLRWAHVFIWIMCDECCREIHLVHSRRCDSRGKHTHLAATTRGIEPARIRGMTSPLQKFPR